MLELPLLLWSSLVFFFLALGAYFLSFTPFPKEEIRDYIAHGPIIRDFTVVILVLADLEI